MARPGTKMKVMYTNEQQDALFEKVHSHIGSHRKISEVLNLLVEKKAEEIDRKETRRDHVAAMREDVDALSRRVDEILKTHAEYTVIMGQVVDALAAQGLKIGEIADLLVCAAEQVAELYEAHTPGR